MEVFNCLINTDRCIEFRALVPCLPEENRCVEDHGYCLMNTRNQTKCICSYCFTGERCEHELSQNIWYVGSLLQTSELITIDTDSIIFYIYGFCLIMNGLLCLQTYLCRKIRQTNLGIYLIILSIISTIYGLLSIIFFLIVSYMSKAVGSFFIRHIICIFIKHITPSVLFMFNWFIAVVAIERMLVECYINYSLHDSRRRSIKFSLFILLICPLSTLPDAFTMRDDSSTKHARTHCQNLTEIGYILHQIIKYIHYCAFYFVYITMNIIVLIKLIKRRQRFVENESTFDQICLILRKHKDFFIPYLVQALAQLPHIILDSIMSCSTADTAIIVYVYLIAGIIESIAFMITFYLYVCLSPVYLSIFWENSLIGRCLMNIKHNLQTIHENKKYYDYLPLRIYR